MALLVPYSFLFLALYDDTLNNKYVPKIVKDDEIVVKTFINSKNLKVGSATLMVTENSPRGSDCKNVDLSFRLRKSETT